MVKDLVINHIVLDILTFPTKYALLNREKGKRQLKVNVLHSQNCTIEYFKMYHDSSTWLNALQVNSPNNHQHLKEDPASHLVKVILSSRKPK